MDLDLDPQVAPDNCVVKGLWGDIFCNLSWYLTLEFIESH